MPAKPIQTNLQLDIPHRERIKRLSETYGWSMTGTVERAVTFLDGMYDLYERQARDRGGPESELLLRILRELGPEAFINKEPIVATIRYGSLPGVSDGERLAIVLDEFAFSEGDDGGLIATSDRGGRMELFHVVDGKLVLRHQFSAGAPILN